METFAVHILGCGSAKPTQRHKPTCQVVDVHSKLFMIDCGEAAQIEFARQGLAMNRLGHIFISHNHGDHVFGLPGLISTMALLGRTAELHIYGPKETQSYLDLIINIYCEGIDYKIHFHPVDTKEYKIIYQDRSVEIYSIPLAHRIPCCGFQICEKPRRPHIRRDMIDAFGIPISQIDNIKSGASWTTEDGTFIPNEKLTTPAEPPRSYTYCSDTAFKPDIIPYIKDTDLLFHEATYSHSMEFRANQTQHSTSTHAAQIAREANAKKLCIGHFSARIQNEDELLNEARAVFQDTILANEGLVINV